MHAFDFHNTTDTHITFHHHIPEQKNTLYKLNILILHWIQSKDAQKSKNY